MSTSVWRPTVGAPELSAPARLTPPSRRPSRRERLGARLRALLRAAAPELALEPADRARLPETGPVLVVTRAGRRGAEALARRLACERNDVLLPSNARAAARDTSAWLHRGGVVIVRAQSLRLLARVVARSRDAGAPIVPACVRLAPAAQGRAVLGAALEGKSLDALANEALRAAAVAWRLEAASARAAVSRAPLRQRAAAAPIVARGEVRWMEAELAQLGPEATLVPHERFCVATARAPQIPSLLREIGRLREITFRAAGEGSGQAQDLDAFDRSYDHLFVWDRRERELAGAYRLAATERILPVFGVQGLYTSTLFRFAPEFFERLGPAVELGRSFVRPEYQRSSQALLLLWKAIARFVASKTRAHVLFGPVSISADYSAWSRALTARVLTTSPEDPLLGTCVTARRPFSGPRLPSLSTACLAATADLSAVVAEATGAELPVLVREYRKLGGRFLAWNLDAQFADVLDGLVLVDLLRTERRLLAFYLGKEASAAFVAQREAGGRLSA